MLADDINDVCWLSASMLSPQCRPHNRCCYHKVMSVGPQMFFTFGLLFYVWRAVLRWWTSISNQRSVPIKIRFYSSLSFAFVCSSFCCRNGAGYIKNATEQATDGDKSIAQHWTAEERSSNTRWYMRWFCDEWKEGRLNVNTLDCPTLTGVTLSGICFSPVL